MSRTFDITELPTRLRNQGVYPTGQRMAVAVALLTKHQHITAEQLHSRLSDSGIKISRATVYNTLNLFAEKGLVREIVVDPAHVYFDSNARPHHHFYNVDEGQLIDSPEPLCQLMPSVELPDGTELEDVDVIVRVRNAR